MDRSKRIKGLQLDENAPVNKQMDPISALEFDVFVHQREQLLPFEWYPSQAELSCQTLLVCRFKQTRTQHAMNFHRRADDFVCQLRVIHFSPQRRSEEKQPTQVTAASS